MIWIINNYNCNCRSKTLLIKLYRKTKIFLILSKNNNFQNYNNSAVKLKANGNKIKNNCTSTLTKTFNLKVSNNNSTIHNINLPIISNNQLLQITTIIT